MHVSIAANIIRLILTIRLTVLMVLRRALDILLHAPHYQHQKEEDTYDNSNNYRGEVLVVWICHVAHLIYQCNLDARS